MRGGPLPRERSAAGDPDDCRLSIEERYEYQNQAQARCSQLTASFCAAFAIEANEKLAKAVPQVLDAAADAPAVLAWRNRDLPVFTLTEPQRTPALANPRDPVPSYRPFSGVA